MTLTTSAKLSKKGQLVIPKQMREVLRVREGDELLVTLEGTRIVLTKPQEYGRRTRGLLKGTCGKSKRAVGRCLDKERRSWG